MEANYSDKDVETWTPLAAAVTKLMGTFLDQRIQKLTGLSSQMNGADNLCLDKFAQHPAGKCSRAE